MPDAPDDELVRELYRSNPDEFVAQRDAAVRRLKQEGDKVGAAALAKLRRPKVAEHALNLLADTDADLVSRWADTVAAAEREQAAAIGGATTDLGARLADLRATSVAVVDAAVRHLGHGGDAHRSAVTDALRSATSIVGAARVRAGLMGAPFEPSDEFFPGAEQVAVRTRSSPKAGTAQAAAGAQAAVSTKAADDATAAAEDERRRLAEETARRQVLERATARHAAATARFVDAQRELGAAEDELRLAVDELAAAEQAAAAVGVKSRRRPGRAPSTGGEG